jgi:hypothetical protein
MQMKWHNSLNPKYQIEKLMDYPRESLHWLSQTQDLFDEASDFPIEKFIADLNVNLMINAISNQLNVQYLIIHEFAFGLTVGPQKWFSNISMLFASFNLHVNVTQDDAFCLMLLVRWLAETVHRLLYLTFRIQRIMPFHLNFQCADNRTYREGEIEDIDSLICNLLR